MKKFLATALTLGMMFGTAGAASAAQGCGPGWHRDPWAIAAPIAGRRAAWWSSRRR